MLTNGLPILRKTEEIIATLKPKFWFIENPKNGRMKDFITNKSFVDVDYCQYGFPYRKSTRIWTNLSYTGRRCNCKLPHKASLGHTTSISLKAKYRIPPALVRDLLMTIIASSN